MYFPGFTVPVLLGDGPAVRRTERTLYWKYHLPFHRFTPRYPLFRHLSVGCRYHKLPSRADSFILVQFLMDFALSTEFLTDGKILLLLTDRQTKDWLGTDHLAQLETAYLLREFGEEETLFSSWVRNSITMGER